MVLSFGESAQLRYVESMDGIEIDNLLLSETSSVSSSMATTAWSRNSSVIVSIIDHRSL